ncbi:his Kinase A domain protein [Ehrlichia chaffeensis str. Heartland]|uniref:sensor histidine kinase n=1 Tax=Ehrlichia chaffeensis TaxID=945 RepID=UPI000444E8D0|nr:HAMP domain-containing sensor histidine kinase [Ehrlichia chaffeensis]AHX03928.1 his Kinase A domain protein [Ehrlichia chaffeensis str. Heartland]AHX06330.1 his Kinase A domain protein [Ehrlichia chaffeensis str. Liberty]AHX07081.1 his Kinase A domain protein [Ehrlichia chaffeensis str. Osceola]AHX08850.1 his Kinase A domain protein [Ehrlichia chaffeensis str. Saint Vincent]AHX09835.1 his Kinase A domain protein [Ehrlichia chaffeensis str. Wakulla]
MKYFRILLLMFLVMTLCFAVGYTHIYLRDDYLYEVSKEINVNIKAILVNSVINKYAQLLAKAPSHVSTNTYYMNLLIKLRAEFLKALGGVKDFHVILYNVDGNVIFSNRSSEDIADQDLLLRSEDMNSLLRGKYVDHRVSNGATTVSIFPIFSLDGQDSSPLMFLKIIKNSENLSSFIVNFYTVFLMIVILVIIIFIVVTWCIYYKNAKMLSKQYNANLKLKEAKEVAEQENVSKSQFLANVSHELRTPLNSIIGFSEMMKAESMGAIENVHYKEYINDIHNAGVHLLSLINDILDFSKAEADKLVVEFVKFDLGKVISSCFNMILPRAEEAKVRLEQVLPSNQIIMVADPKRMKQVIINLLSNSIKFTPENGCVKLVVEYDLENSMIVIEVIDNGIGIAQQDLYKVMSVFGQVDSRHARKYEGTGLGLPLSKKLVELMDGVFKIKSEPNLGTIVTLTFPYTNTLEEKGF